MNLISSKDFRKFLTEKSDSEYRRLRENFDNFLEKPLKLGYFIPCDENDVPLEEPINFEVWERLHFNNGKTEKGTIGFKEHEKYQEAKQKVIFEGFELHNNKDAINNKLGLIIVFGGIISVLIEGNNGLGGFSKNNITIEDLVNFNLKLTETAKKEIGIL